MAAIGGSLEEINIEGRSFPMTADADVSMKLSGRENEVSANGNGTARILKTAVVSMLTGLVVECDTSRADLEFLQDIADRNAFVAIALTYASGDVYQGRATVSGELTYNGLNATASFDMAGEGRFTKQ